MQQKVLPRQKPQPSMYACPYCPRLSIYSSKPSLKKHVSVHHREQHMTMKMDQKLQETTCTHCKKTFSRAAYTVEHEAACELKLMTQLIYMADHDSEEIDKGNLPNFVYPQMPVPSFSANDGAEDILEWEKREVEEDLNNRPPVAIQCDIIKLNWKELVRVQLDKYGHLFHVILMDPPWRVNLKLKYPALRDEDIMAISFELLQSDGYLMISILDMKEEKIKAMLKQRGYKYKAKLVWGKLTKKGKPVNGSGVTARH